VHLAGLPCPDTYEIKTTCREQNLFLIEDCAHAHGAMIDGKKTGSFGDAGCFSFFPTKLMTTGTGGMITTDDEALAEYACSLRNHGAGTDLTNIVNLGNDWLMTEIDALLGIYQLKVLETNLTNRNKIANKYAEGLSKSELAQPFQVPPGIRHSYYKYPVILSDTVDKKKFVRQMRDSFEVETGSVYDPPCYLQPVYRRLFGYREGMFPKADAIINRTCCLPMFAGMTENEVDYVLSSLEYTLPVCVPA
jgi:dTDP-4-amino-4,6-dideoxygalactose transaminase